MKEIRTEENLHTSCKFLTEADVMQVILESKVSSEFFIQALKIGKQLKSIMK